MQNEVRRNNWSRFCKRFNSSNQYRPTSVNIKRRGENAHSYSMTPFLGMALSKKGRVIEGVQFFTGRWHPEQVMEPVLTIEEPSQIWLEKDKSGRDNRLKIRAKDGTEAMLELSGDPEPQQAVHLVEKVAYSMYERRGYSPGNDWGDWFAAEERVREAEMNLIR